MKVLHIITGLENGGAEGVLYRLSTSDNENTHVVISMIGKGKYGPLLEDEAVEVYFLEIYSVARLFCGVVKLFSLICKIQPDVVQTWMYHADLVGGVVAKLAGVKTVFWNVRHTTFEPRSSKRSTIMAAKACSFLSGWVPTKIIYCAREAQTVHEGIGYKKGKAKVIANGFDVRLFDNRIPDGNRFRSEVGIHINELLLGMVGRFHPQKDHFNLIAALKLVKQTGYEFKLVLIGRGLDDQNQDLLDCVRAANLTENVILLGQRSDIPNIMNGLDIHVLSSAFGEAFPNVLAEAMACGTPCVTTDVGDSASIVGNAGWIVPVRDPKVLSVAVKQAIDEMLNDNQSWLNRKRLCRSLIANKFSVQTMLDNYHKAWKEYV